ncbi:hypothetical protein Glove_328g23 [Diversispora epigaea]|uniref:Mitochondrial carrier n=1 Tax=Diversispora epigaea TaxID=1348612 RepID=A0A397HP31_9GLOM|nr:hypothetical protein Glove_328g23 [Diversispora epigaea]
MSSSADTSSPSPPTSTNTKPRYTYTPFPQTTTVHPLRPYYVPPNNDHYYTPFGNSTNTKEERNRNLVDEESQLAIKDLISFGFVKFISSAISNPLEVAKTLLQVQYLPNEDVVPIARENKKVVDSDESDEDGDDDDILNNQSHKTFDPNSSTFRQSKTLDSQGYISTDIYDEATRPKYMLPPLEHGVKDTIVRLFKHPTEGFKSLWKGQLTNWIYELCYIGLQPSIEGTLNDAFDLYDDTIPIIYLDRVAPNIATMVTSHVITGTLLSPLEVARTRLIVQTSSPIHKKYSGPFDCLLQMIKEEGFSSLYWSHNLLPSIVYHTICPLLDCTIPLIIDRIFHINPADSPFIFGLAQFGLNTLQLMITLPIETIRRRLHCQIRSRTPNNDKPFETIVQIRKAPYTGMLDAAYKIIMEEGISQTYVPKHGNQRRRSERRQKSWLDNYGVGGLYRGFYWHCVVNFVQFLVQVTNGAEGGFEDF